MTPASVKVMYARQMDAHGESMALMQGATLTAVRGRILRPKFDALVDTMQQTMPRAVILAEDLGTIVPQKGDVLTAGDGDYVVDDVDGVTRRVAGVVIAYDLTLAGT